MTYRHKNANVMYIIALLHSYDLRKLFQLSDGSSISNG